MAQAVDSTLVTLHWSVGRRIGQDVLGGKRATYGKQIVSALRRQLSWTHFKQLFYMDDALKRDFYAEMCRLEKWSTRTLEQKLHEAVQLATQDGGRQCIGNRIGSCRQHAIPHLRYRHRQP